MRVIRNNREWRGFEYFLEGLTVVALVGIFVILFTQRPDLLSIHFSVVSTIDAIATLTDTFLLILINTRRHKLQNSFWFSFFLAMLIFWGMSEFFQYMSIQPAAAVFWSLLTNVGGTFVVVFGLFFVITQTKPQVFERTLMPWIGLFVTAVLFFFSTTVTNVFEITDPSRVLHQSYGLQTALTNSSWLWYGWIQVLLITIGVLLVVHYRKQKNPIERRRSLFFVIGTMILIIGGSVTDVVFPLLNIDFIPLAVPLSTVQAIFFAYGLLRYNLFIINPATVAPNILQTMAEAVFVTDRNHTILFANEQASKLRNDATHNDVGTNLMVLFDSQTQQQIQHRVSHLEKDDQVIKLEDIVVYKNGHEAVGSFDVRASFILEEGTPSGIVWLMNDISSLKEAYARLEDEKTHVEQKVVERTHELSIEHARLRSSVENLPVGFVMTGPQAEVVTYNKMTVELFSSADPAIIRKKLYEELHLDNFIKQCMIDRMVRDIGEVVYDKKTLHIIVSPILNEDSARSVAGAVVLIQDVTQAKLLENERNQFIMTSSHELRTPVAVIEGALSNAANPTMASVDERGKVFVDKAYGEARHLGELFRDLESVANIIGGSQKPTFTTFDLIEIVRDASAKFESAALEKGLKLQVASPPKRVLVSADVDNVKEVLTKLIENALKFTTKGYVEVIIEADLHEATVKVVDTGMGISLESQPRLFKQFSRVQNELRRENGGTGLGLYIARNLVEMNHGTMRLESKPGEGSTFIFTLPIVAASNQTPGQP